MRPRRFQQVDVFTSVPFLGNPVAVIFDADDLSVERMRSIARWTNLSETTFVCTPTDSRADYRLRIFTPRDELPFAGHPTLGSAHAVLRLGLKPRTPGRLVQQCGRGLIDLRLDDGRVALRLPPARIVTPTPTDLNAATEALGVTVADVSLAGVVDLGPTWLTLRLPDAAAVLGLSPDMARVAGLGASHVDPAGAGIANLTGVTVFGSHPSGDAAFEVRSFAPAHGVPEDPVCGSGNGAVATLLRNDASTPQSYVATQGACVGRAGRVFVCYETDDIWLGGDAATCIEGTILA